MSEKLKKAEHQLTKEELITLWSYKGERNGANQFLDKLEKIYKSDEEIMKAIKFCRDIKDSMDWIETWPAHEKTRSMYYHYMDDLLDAIGYRKPDVFGQ